MATPLPSTPDIYFGPGNNAPEYTDTLEGPSGVIDLTDATVTFRYSRADGNGPLVEEAATILGDATEGNVKWKPDAELEPGDYACDWHVERGVDVFDVPNDRNLLMRVKTKPRP